ncbi:hypothetical protein Trydic_g19432 [Trypoxylus dichotomus]
MNNFPPPAKYQQQDDNAGYGTTNRPTYLVRHAKLPPSRTSANKHTNTPTEFMVCSRCHEKIGNKETYANCPLGDCDRSLAEYTKALNYINSCHGIINQMMNQTNKNYNLMKMPDLPNFLDLFHSLTGPQNTPSQGGEGSAKSGKKSTHESRYNPQFLNAKNSRPISSPLYPGRQQNSEDSALKLTTKGKFIELLPDVKQSTYRKQDNFSPGTTESEESDLELNMNIHKNTRISMSNKFKSKIKTAHEKVIYEEESVEDDSGMVFKKDQDGKFNRKSKEDLKNKPKISSIPGSPTPPRNKVLSASLLPTGVNGTITNENARKLKQRSSSTVTPREKAKLFGKRSITTEVGGNFSDTVITAGSCIGQAKKFGTKTLCTPIDMRNNELSQQELDKYAKELLGSESPSSRSPRSKSPASIAFRSPASTDKQTKSDQQDKNKKFQKPIPSPTLKSQAADQKRRNNQDKSSINCSNGNSLNVNSPKATSASSTNIQQRQEQQINASPQARRYRKSYTAQHQQQMEQSQNKKIGCCRRNANSYNNGNISQNQSKNNGYCYGNANQECNVNDRSKSKETATVQEENDEANDDVDGDNELDQLDLLCDNTETLSMHSRVPKRRSDKSILPPKISPQYSVTPKSNDFFTNRKGSHETRIVCDKVEEDVDYEENADSDIKTDSDIEEDHFEKQINEVPLSRKSSKINGPSAQLTQVLSHLGLLPNAQLPAEAEQLIKEAKSTRAHDERNRPFREPRKANEDHNERIVKLEDDSRITEAYTREGMLPLCRTISEESSDIKTDEDIYSNMEANHSKSIPYNFCLGNGRYQP